MSFAYQQNKGKNETDTKHQLLVSTPNPNKINSPKTIQSIMKEISIFQNKPYFNQNTYNEQKNEDISTGLCETQHVYSATNKNNNNFTNVRNKFPESFNPRKEVNMPHKEKVEKWIVDVPATPINESCSLWQNKCYNPLIPTSDECEVSGVADFDMGNVNDVIEYQSRTITFLTNQNYFTDRENVRKCDGKTVQGGVDYSLYLDNYTYNDIHQIRQYEQFDDYNLQG